VSEAVQEPGAPVQLLATAVEQQDARRAGAAANQVAALGEELGLFGLVALILLYLLIVERGMRIALTGRDEFGKLLAAGLAFTIGWQVFLIIGGVTGLLPLTGLTTPFLAYGGSSLVANFALIALLLRISHTARRPSPPPPVYQPRLGDALTEIVTP